LQNFTDFFCNHVKRVREIVPPDRLVEVDIEDPSAGHLLSDIFDIDESCWKMTNVNEKLHMKSEEILDRKKNSSIPHKSEGLPMLIQGKARIRGKNGVMRMNPSYQQTVTASLLPMPDGRDGVLNNSTNDAT
jgi:hypothetical protein